MWQKGETLAGKVNFEQSRAALVGLGPGIIVSPHEFRSPLAQGRLCRRYAGLGVMTLRLALFLLFLVPMAARAADRYAEAKTIILGQCAACHRVPGVPGAVGGVGPSLKGFAKRQIVAGKLPNSPANLVRWLMHPQQIVPGNAMPELGLTEDQARKIAAYLYTLDKE